MASGPREVLFVGFLTAVLTVGVLGVLLLNTAMQQQSDRMDIQRQRVASLIQQAEQIRTQIDRLATPQQLAARARRLHMQPVKRLRFTVAGASVSRQTREAGRSPAN